MQSSGLPTHSYSVVNDDNYSNTKYRMYRPRFVRSKSNLRQVKVELQDDPFSARGELVAACDVVGNGFSKRVGFESHDLEPTR